MPVFGCRQACFGPDSVSLKTLDKSKQDEYIFYNKHNLLHRCNPPIKPGKVGQFDTGRGKVEEIRESRGNCVLPVVYCCKCDIHITYNSNSRILLSKVDMHKLDCQQCHRSDVKFVNKCFHIHSGVHVRLSRYHW